jgi:hypothetical protein
MQTKKLLGLMGVGIVLIACALPVFSAMPGGTGESPSLNATQVPIGTAHVTPAPNSQTPNTPGLPDLVPNGYSVLYDNCPWGGPGTIKVYVNNVGETDAGPFKILVEDTDTVNINGLAAGQQAEASITFNSGPVGFVVFVVDVENQVTESNEANNDYKIIFTPPPPCSTTVP